MDRKYKMLIPKLLTFTRIILTPFIIIFGLLDYIFIVLILTILAAISDFFDGFLARKWDTTSIKGAKLDAIADKVFAVGLIISLIPNFELFKTVLLLEIIIGLVNLYIHYITSRVESLYIGKFKTTVLFISIILAIASNLFLNVDTIVYSLIYVVINLQILSIVLYIINYFKKEQEKPTLEKNEMHKEIMNSKEFTEKFIDDLTFTTTSTVDEQLEDTLVLSDLQDLENKIFDVEKEDIY